VVPEDARRHNRSLVLQQLLRHGPMARADLARATKLTPATVGDLVGNLLEEGIAEELGRRMTGTGKPATLLGIVSDARHVVCLDLSDQSRLVGAVVSLTGTIVTRRTAPRRSRVGAGLVSLVADLAGKLIADTDRPVLGVGIGTPGVVFPGGIVHESANLQWHGVPLADRLSESLTVPIHVVNDANAAVLGEFQFGNPASSNMLVVKIGLGVGAGLLVDGHLVEGDGLAAGEIGHVVVEEDGELCACGNRGCLETVVAGPLLKARLAGLDRAGRETVLVAAGRHVGIVLAPVVSMLNLNEVVLSGPTWLLGEPFHRAVLATVKQRTIAPVGEELNVRYGVTGADDVLLGAAVVVLTERLGVR
jgi:predicted NBD/HSP70 family sugar kinase